MGGRFRVFLRMLLDESDVAFVEDLVLVNVDPVLTGCRERLLGLAVSTRRGPMSLPVGIKLGFILWICLAMWV